MMETVNTQKINEIKELDDDGSDSVLKGLINLFLNSTHPKLKKILECHYLKDYPTARKEAHLLRSSALTLGAEVLSQCAHDIEYAKDGPELETTVGTAVKKALQEFELVKKELEKYLS